MFALWAHRLLLVVLMLSLTWPALAQDEPDAKDILVWIEAGSSAAQSSASVAGELGLVSENGDFTPLQEVPAQTSRVQLCGDAATAPDGQTVAFYVGLDAGTLYLMQGKQTPIALDEIGALTCIGSRSFTYSPDSQMLAYINYAADAATQEYAAGNLTVRQTSNQAESARFESVVSYDLRDDGAALISFYANDRGEADEAVLTWWDGRTTREIVTLRPDEACRYTSASLISTDEDRLLVQMGHRCRTGDTRTSWQLYDIDMTVRSATLAASAFQDGQFAPFARTNQLLLLPDETHALFSVPDGITANTTSLRLINLQDYTITEVIPRQVVWPTLSGARNATPRVSPDGRWLAMIITTPDDENTLAILDLQDPTLPPLTFPADSRQDIITGLNFTQDSARVVYLTGSAATGRAASNALVTVDLTTGEEMRIKRGRFLPPLVLDASGQQVVLVDYQVMEDERQPPWLHLVEINLETSETMLLFEGADIIDGSVTNLFFAVPLTWR